MAAEVVVVIEDQDLLIGTEGAAPEMGGGQARNASADDHEVVRLVRIDLERGELSIRALLHGSERFDRGRIVPAQTSQRRRIGRLFHG